MSNLIFKSKRFLIKTITQKECTKNYVNWIVREKFIEYKLKNKPNISSLKNFVKKKNNKFFLAIFSKTNKHIGNIKFDLIDIKRKYYDMGILIGDENWKYKGVFKEVFLTVLPHLNYMKKPSKIFLGVKKNNLKAKDSFKKVGFKIFKKRNNSIIMVYDLLNKFHDIKRLILGTAQLNNKYGYFKNNLNSEKKINELLSLSKDYGIDTIDTAYAYKNLDLIKKSNFISKFKIIYKIKNLSEFDYIRKNKNFFKKFEIMIHNENFIKDITEIKKVAKKANIGFSIYSANNLEKISQYKFINILQVPINIFNQEFLMKRNLKILRKFSELHIRSVFLQGLLINQNLPKKFGKFKNIHSSWFDWIYKNKLNPINVCLNYVLNKNKNDKIIIGVNSSENLKEIIQNLWIKNISIPKYFARVDKNFSKIENWKKL